MEQIAAKVASLVVPPAQQHRGELVVEKPSEEKGRQPGEARRRRPLETSTVEVKGAGGIVVLGGLLVATAVAAGVTIVARRAQAKRPPGSKKEKAEGLNGNDKIDGSAGIQEEDDCVSVKPKSSSSEAVTCDGVEELRNGRELGWQQLDEKNWGKTDLGLQNGIGKKEIDQQVSLGEAEHGMIDNEDDKESDLGMNKQQSEELDKEASPVEAEDLVNHDEIELKESVPASGNGEKEDEPSLKLPHVDYAESIPAIEISKQGCESVRHRDEKVLPFLEESKESQFEMAECKFNVSRPVGPLTFKEIVEQQKVEASPSELEEEARPQMDVSEQQTARIIDEHKQQKEHEILTVESEDKVKHHQTEQISASEFALVNEEKEPKEPQFHMIESEPSALKEDKKELSVEHVLNGYGIEKIEQHIEEKEETEASPEGEEKAEDEAIEEKKEPESSVEGEDDGTYSNQTEPHIIHSEVGTEEFSATKETEEKAQPASFAEEEGSNNKQTQTEQVIDEHKQQKEHEILTVESEDKVNQHQTEQISGSELALVNEEKEPKEARFHVTESEPFALKEDEKEEVKALSVGQQSEHVLNEHDLTKIEEHVEEKEETEASPEGNEEKIEEKKEAEESPEGEEDEEEIEDEKEPKTSHEDEEAIEEKKVPEASVEGEDDGNYNNQTQPHIIHDEVSTEEFSTTKETEETDEKNQPASFAEEEEEGSNNNQTQTNTADPQFSTEDHSTVKQVEKVYNEKEEPESFPEEEAQMRDEGSDSAPVSSAEESNEAVISPAEAVEQGKILLQEVQSKVSSDYLISSGEVKVNVHVKKVEEKQQESIAERESIVNNMVQVNKAEEKEEESMIGGEKITKDEMQQQLMATIKKKALMLEKLLMDIPDRLLVVLLVISLIMVLLHYVKPFSQPYQMISPSDEKSQGI
ncbi:glutamic acid-rich protein-like [Zingiber officinale]|uniref:glutamic acid-rich protein-like n=1 Tax=Zingiber officinale TaxID=94328 RepID=UPI001C4CE980|nr:glutamic acid-rich protein-like [Zingiber officinale]